MNRAAAVAQIQRLLGMRSDLETEIIQALQDAQVDLESEPELPWFLVSEVSSTTTTPAESRVPLPTDFIREAPEEEGGGLFLYDSTADEDEQWTPLEKVSLNVIRQAYQSTDGEPEVYALDDEYFRLAPIPDDTYTLKMVFYQKDDILDTNIENKWLAKASELIIGIAGRKVAEAVRDAGALQTFANMEVRGRKRLEDFAVARQEEGRTRQMGGKD